MSAFEFKVLLLYDEMWLSRRDGAVLEKFSLIASFIVTAAMNRCYRKHRDIFIQRRQSHFFKFHRRTNRQTHSSTDTDRPTCISADRTGMPMSSCIISFALILINDDVVLCACSLSFGSFITSMATDVVVEPIRSTTASWLAFAHGWGIV